MKPRYAFAFWHMPPNTSCLYFSGGFKDIRLVLRYQTITVILCCFYPILEKCVSSYLKDYRRLLTFQNDTSKNSSRSFPAVPHDLTLSQLVQPHRQCVIPLPCEGFEMQIFYNSFDLLLMINTYRFLMKPWAYCIILWPLRHYF